MARDGKVERNHRVGQELVLGDCFFKIQFIKDLKDSDGTEVLGLLERDNDTLSIEADLLESNVKTAESTILHEANHAICGRGFRASIAQILGGGSLIPTDSMIAQIDEAIVEQFTSGQFELFDRNPWLFKMLAGLLGYQVSSIKKTKSTKRKGVK